MAKEPIIVGLDIGSKTIRILGAQEDSNSGLYRVNFFEELPSVGLNKGRIRDEKALTKKLIDIIKKTEQKYNTRVDLVNVNISGSRLELISNKASVSVGGANGKVSAEDKERVLEDVKAVSLGNNRRFLKLFPKKWNLDGETEFSDPFGLTGVRLELEASILTCFSSDYELLENAVLNADVDIESIVPSPIAGEKAVLTEEQKDLGVALVDIGAETTSMVVFEEGKILSLVIFPVGSANITNDLAIGLQTETSITEKIKQDYGLGDVNTKKIEIHLPTFLNEEDLTEEEEKEIKKNKNERDVLSFTGKDLKNIIEPRISEMFDLIKAELKKIDKNEKLPAGIILTGGGSKLKGLEDFAKKEFKLPCKIGVCGKFIGIDKKDPACATVCGLILSEEEFDDDRKSKGGIGETFKKIFRNFNP